MLVIVDAGGEVDVGGLLTVGDISATVAGVEFILRSVPERTEDLALIIQPDIRDRLKILCGSEIVSTG